MRHPKLTESEISLHITDLPGWAIQNNSLQRTYEFPNEADAKKFVDEVNGYANNLGHHPDISTSGNSVSITLTTHDVGGITRLDFQLAQEIESAAGDTEAHPKDGIADTEIDPLTA